MSKIWENDEGDAWVEQNDEDLLFYSQGRDQEGRNLVVVDMAQLVEIIQNTENPDETLSRLELSDSEEL